jgi:hypothetical protein
MQGDRNKPARVGDLESRVDSVPYFDNTPRLSFIDKPLS